MTVSCGSSSMRDVLDRRNVLEPEHVADLHMRDVDLDVLGDVRRERLDVDLARDEREHPARLRALGLADELDDDGRVDGLVETHLAQVDVRDRPAQRILLVLGEDRRMHRRLALDHHVEDRVQAGGACDGSAQRALGDRRSARVTLAVQHAGNEPLRSAVADSRASRDPRARAPRASTCLQTRRRIVATSALAKRAKRRRDYAGRRPVGTRVRSREVFAMPFGAHVTRWLSSLAASALTIG